MKTTQKQASKRLFKKLSALRATLSNSECVILDRILGSEVEAHQLKTKTVAKTQPRINPKEVEAHQLKTKTVAKTQPRINPKEVEAKKPAFRIAFDPNSEEYKISE